MSPQLSDGIVIKLNFKTQNVVAKQTPNSLSRTFIVIYRLQHLVRLYVKQVILKANEQKK